MSDKAPSDAAPKTMDPDSAHDRKSLEIIIDLHVKSLGLLTDGLMKGFTLYFVLVATVFGFIATRSKTQVPATTADFFNAITLLQVITGLAAVGAMLAAYGIARGARRLGIALERYNSILSVEMSMPSMFRKAVFLTYAASAVALCALGYIIYIANFFTA